MMSSYSLAVLRGGAGGGARRGSGASGSDDAAAHGLSLAQTISEGAGTAPMAAAALDELLGFSTDKGGASRERFVD